jgi:serine/threonine protein kinase
LSLTAPAGRHRPGQIVAGRYKLLSAVGSGGMGVVFKAEDAKLRRTVALKFLPAEIGADRQAKMRFLREAQATAVLDHPNICPVHEIDESDGEVFLTMAFIEGGSIKDRIDQGPLPLIEVLGIASQVARVSAPRMTKESFTGTSSRPTSCSAMRVRFASRISAWLRSKAAST